nr:MAG TPA: hypothetical protein [Caudoviricetes sp.]
MFFKYFLLYLLTSTCAVHIIVLARLLTSVQASVLIRFTVVMRSCPQV